MARDRTAFLFEAIVMHRKSWDFSVVIPLMDGRGEELECIRTWTHGQSLPRARYQVILVSGGDNPPFAQAAAELLSPQDRMVSASGPVHALYAAGADAAAGTYLFFTELHCEADPDCLQAMSQWLCAHPKAAGACVGSRNRNLTPLAELEEAVIERLCREWTQPDHWRRVLVRGTALSRAAYFAVGGFDGELNYFADVALAARLHRAGFFIGFAPDAVVTHRNSTSYAMIRSVAAGYALGLQRFALRDGAQWENYVSMPAEWRAALGDTRGQAFRDLGLFAKSLLAALRRPRRFAPLWNACRASLGGRLLTAFAGRGWRSRLLTVRLLLHRLQLRMPKFLGLNRAAIFQRIWELTNEQELLRLAEKTDHHTAPLAVGVWGVKDIGPQTWRGVHGVEQENDTAFRWTEPVWRLQCAPMHQRAWELTATLHDASSAKRLLAVFHNGRQLPAHALTLDGARLRIRVPAGRCEEVANDLLFVCEPFRPRRFGSTDQRDLGLAIAGFELRADTTETVSRRPRTASLERVAAPFARVGEDHVVTTDRG
jgi:hypothetical protein